MTEQDATMPAGTPRRRRGPRALLITLGVVVLACAVFWIVYTNWSGPGVEPRAVDEPIAVTPGEPFAFGGFSYEADWDLRTTYGDLTIVDLVATNTGEDSYYPDIAVSLEQDGAEVARITCSSSGVQPGGSVFLQCRSDDEPPSEYDRVVVSDDHVG